MASCVRVPNVWILPSVQQVVYQDTDESIPDDDELHGPHFGDTDSEDALTIEEFDPELDEGEDQD